MTLATNRVARPSSSPFCVSVRHIFSVCPDEQVLRVDAAWIVAPVTNLRVIWSGGPGKNAYRNTVGKVIRPGVVKSSVPVGIYIPRPIPAAAGGNDKSPGKFLSLVFSRDPPPHSRFAWIAAYRSGGFSAVKRMECRSTDFARHDDRFIAPGHEFQNIHRTQNTQAIGVLKNLNAKQRVGCILGTQRNLGPIRCLLGD